MNSWYEIIKQTNLKWFILVNLLNMAWFFPALAWGVADERSRWPFLVTFAISYGLIWGVSGFITGYRDGHYGQLGYVREAYNIFMYLAAYFQLGLAYFFSQTFGVSQYSGWLVGLAVAVLTALLVRDYRTIQSPQYDKFKLFQ